LLRVDGQVAIRKRAAYEADVRHQIEPTMVFEGSEIRFQV
jgi:hypothetical protein